MQFIQRLALLTMLLLVGCRGSDSEQPGGQNNGQPQSGSPPRLPRFVKADLPHQGALGDYVTSQACKECHQSQHESWHRTFHRTMTQVASPEAIVPSFDNVELTADGRTSRLSRKGEEYWVEMVDPAWERQQSVRGIDTRTLENVPIVNRKVVMTTGSHRRQSFWVRSEDTRPGNEVFQFPWTYQIAEQKWVPIDDAFVRPPTGARDYSPWNENCISCHAVAGNPGLDLETRFLYSQVAEFGISCEACHGPGKQHMEVCRDRDNLPADLAIFNPAKVGDHRLSTQACGQCHSFSFSKDAQGWWTEGRKYRPGQDLHEVRNVLQLADAMNSSNQAERAAVHGFWADGTVRTGGREYNGLVKSACHTTGKLSCVSCHSMHQADRNGQIKEGFKSNRACTSCHAEHEEKIEQHTHHAAGSSGSLCYNCHMPHTTYALFRTTRSHRIDSPSAHLSQQTGRPNACNLCHIDKSLSWTGKYLQDWYGQQPPSFTPLEQELAASTLWLLQGDAAQRLCVAAAIGRHAGTKDVQQAIPLLSIGLNDPYAAVRWISGASLQKFEGWQDTPYDWSKPASERADFARQLRETWSQRDSSAQEFPSLLIRGGKWDQQRSNELLKGRNMKDVYISE